MPVSHIDRDNGYAKTVWKSSLLPLSQLEARSEELKEIINGRDPKRICSRSDELLFRKQYGISVYDYEELWYEQGGKCAICKKEPTRRRLVVDHCHTTGKIRGLLCSNCNTALGMFKDKIPSLISALEYLRERPRSTDH